MSLSYGELVSNILEHVDFNFEGGEVKHIYNEIGGVMENQMEIDNKARALSYITGGKSRCLQVQSMLQTLDLILILKMLLIEVFIILSVMVQMI